MTVHLRRLAILAVLAIAGCGAPAASGPPASPRISCLGIPAAKCDEAVTSVARSLPNTAPVSIEVSCIADRCTSESGAMDTVVTLADGSQLHSTTLTWANAGGQKPDQAEPAQPATAPPVPFASLPVEPVCQGVPASLCRTMAETAFGELSDQAVVQILVRCGEPPCTGQHGVGDTLVTYIDGTTRTSSWEYAGS